MHASPAPKSFSQQNEKREHALFFGGAYEVNNLWLLSKKSESKLSASYFWSGRPEGVTSQKKKRDFFFCLVSYSGGAYEIQTHDLYYAIVAL